MSSLSVQQAVTQKEQPVSQNQTPNASSLDYWHTALVATIVASIAAAVIAVYVYVNYTQGDFFTSDTAAYAFAASLFCAMGGGLLVSPFLYFMMERRREEILASNQREVSHT